MMKVEIREDIYDNYPDADEMTLDLLDMIAGQVLVVDTEFLFPDEFNVLLNPNDSDDFIRVFIEDVEEVYNDERVS